MTASLSPATAYSSHPLDDVPLTVQDRRRIGFFMVDNEIIDCYASRIGAYAFTVYSALIRFANKDGVCFPSLNTLAERLGCSKPTVIKALETLIEYGLIKKVHRFNEKEEHISNLYIILEVKQEPPREDGGSKRDLPKQNTLIFNKTQQREQDTQAPQRSHEHQSAVSETNKAVVVALTDVGMSNKVAEFLASKYSEERISEKIAYLEFMQDMAPDSIKSPCGWLRTAIVDDFARPDGFMAFEEREALETQDECRDEDVADGVRPRRPPAGREHPARSDQLRAAQEAQAERKEKQEARRQTLTGQYGTTGEDFAFWEQATLEISYRGRFGIRPIFHHLASDKATSQSKNRLLLRITSVNDSFLVS